jgi:phosphatidate cytidylyltransferase
MDEGDDEYGEYAGWEEEEEEEEPKPPTLRTPAEGVRIIGAEEAATALESGIASGRRPEDAPRYGDVPEPPAGPRPAHRFPLPDSVDPASAVTRPPVITPPPVEDDFEPVASPEMPHWTEPATGEVPAVLASDDDEDDLNAWSGLTNRAPRWRDQEQDWEEPDFGDASHLADDELRQGVLDPDRTEHSDLFSFDEPPIRTDPEATRTLPPPPAAAPRRSRPVEPTYAEPGGGAPRDLQQAVAIGVGLGVLALLCFKLGPLTSMILVTAVVMLAAVEVFDVLRRAGYKPATLLGLAATGSALLASYNYGITGLLLVTALTIVTTFLWFLFGVEPARPTVNIAVTLLGYLWVGFLGSYATLILAVGRPGITILLGAVLATVANDVGALLVGRQAGSRPLAPEVSPNKTWEGIIGGGVASIAVCILVLRYLPGVFPWDGGKAFWLGVVVAIVAPLGDLCESMVKRDIGIKDMGTLLPGHGGVLDRFDAMLFVLPATFYLVSYLFHVGAAGF